MSPRANLNHQPPRPRPVLHNIRNYCALTDTSYSQACKGMREVRIPFVRDGKQRKIPDSYVQKLIMPE